VHVLDAHPLDGSDPVANHAAVERELAQHNPRLAELPRVLALSKGDLLDEAAREQLRQSWIERLSAEVPVIVTSAVTRLGLRELAAELLRLIPADDHPPDQAEQGPSENLPQHRVFRPAGGPGYRVKRTGEHSFDVSGDRIERLLARYDLDNEEALAYLETRLRSIGLIDALKAQGFEPGDEVVIAGVAFDLDPEG